MLSLRAVRTQLGLNFRAISGVLNRCLNLRSIGGRVDLFPHSLLRGLGSRQAQSELSLRPVFLGLL